MSEAQNMYDVIAGKTYSERFKKKVRLLRECYILLLAAAAVFLYFLRFRVPLLPDIFRVDFSAFPELLATFAYGPLYGLAICVVKTAVHVLLLRSSLLPDVTTFVVEAIFIVTAGSYYARQTEETVRRTSKKPGRAFRAKMMLGGSLLGLLPALAAQFLITQFILYPELGERFAAVYSKESLVRSYATAWQNIGAHLPDKLAGMLPKITHVWQGILLINLPVTLAKLLAMLLLAMAAYLLLLPILYVKIPKSDYQIDGVA